MQADNVWSGNVFFHYSSIVASATLISQSIHQVTYSGKYHYIK